MTELALSERPAWTSLARHFRDINHLHLRQLFGADPRRGERLTLKAEGICPAPIPGVPIVIGAVGVPVELDDPSRRPIVHPSNSRSCASVLCLEKTLKLTPSGHTVAPSEKLLPW